MFKVYWVPKQNSKIKCKIFTSEDLAKLYIDLFTNACGLDHFTIMPFLIKPKEILYPKLIIVN